MYGAIQVETLLSVMYVSEWDEQSDLDLSTGSSTVLHVCMYKNVPLGGTAGDGPAGPIPRADVR